MKTNVTDTYQRFSYTFTLSTTADIIFNVWSNIYFKNLQLERGTILTDYEERVQKTLPLTLGDIELAENDYIFDESYRWYLYDSTADTTTELTNSTLLEQLDNILSMTTYKYRCHITSNSTPKIIIDLQYYTKDNIKFETAEVDKIAGFVDNVEAVRQAVYHILMTERYAYLIYDDNYGVELEQYIGKDIEYLRNTIQGTLREALTHDLRILNVEVNNINQISDDVAEIYFTVESIYGNLQMEVNINV